MREQTLLLNHQQIEQKINRMAFEIYENNADEKVIVLAGIADRGFVFASRLAKILNQISGRQIIVLELKLNKTNPSQHTSSLKKEEINGRSIVVVDDVLESGRTLIYGVNLFLAFEPTKIATAVLVNRNHKKFPVHVDFVGLSLATTLREHIRAEFVEGNDAVYLE